ncbi:AfsR/SARP family transcriptional regulator [Nonomuraea sp. NN258]|uniref:BTAD domain-containing putative transcriptional regulator n=1 Tax=Nonomuraea antri TaxID=2730852 RepID=UPI00156A312D|nr:BTAD domain-containing putative transcriptional regulator [Nonomuraea antri]NRQ37361.1 AfsR/SARP family transcriptional regulator [Nonomuraea antri]
MEFGVLGPLAVWSGDGQPVRVPELKVRALLADLLIHEGRPVPADRLADDLWGDDLPGNPVNTLQTKVSQLRRALERAEPGGRDLVVHQPAGYLLKDPVVDARRFAVLLAAARAAEDARTRSGLLSDALALWRGPAYADFRDEEFARATAARLDEQRLTALEEQAEVRLELGEHTLLADELAELVAEHPLRERLRAAHLRALYRSGRQSEALAGYADLRRKLGDELGLDPSPDLVRLHQAMLEQDPALTPVPAPATSAARPRTNLPVPLTELVGREESVAQVRGLLESARLVTLTGPGGVGKTRLALATAATMDFPDGVWLVELAGAAGPGDAPAHPDTRVEDAVAAALGVRDETAVGSRPGVRPQDLARRLADSLGDQRLLLVLDNCEHLIEPVADLVDLLLGSAPGLRVLATSQESLAIPGETVHPVAPLDLPEPGAGLESLARAGAVRLFVARAAAAAPGFALDAENAPHVAAICRRLDGLPLALELAATRVRGLGVRGLAERLDDRFRLLAASARGLPARQRTLRAMIDWSWEQLDEPQRLVLCRLAVHPGGCLLEAAEAVCADDPGSDYVPEVLARLVDRSMVVAERHHSGRTRYRLLESVAAYCLERLPGDDPAWARRDAYYLDLAERAEPHLYGPAQRDWLRRLDDETLNLRAVLDRAASPRVTSRLAGALAWYWYLRGRHREAHRSLSRALDSGQADARTSAWEAGFAMLIGDGTGLAARSRTAAEGLGPSDARWRWFLAHAHLHFGDVAGAEGLVARALGEFRALDDRWGQAAALSSRCKLALFQGDLALAERSGAESLEIFTSLGDGWGQLQASDQLGWLAEINGDYERAGRLHRDGLRAAEDLRLWTDVSYRLSSLGRIALLTGELERAVEFHERGMRLASEQANRFAEEFARVGLGLVARRRGDLDTAESLFQESLAWNRRLADDYGVPFYGLTLLLAELGFVAERRGDAAAARARHLEGLAAAREGGDPRAVALAYEGLAGAATLAGQHREAARLLGTAAALRESVGAPLPPAERGDVDRITARARTALGETAYAEAFDEAFSEAVTESRQPVR